MKKTCNKCKALENSPSNILILKCILNFKQKNGKPQEHCPKPLTNKDFLNYENNG